MCAAIDVEIVDEAQVDVRLDRLIRKGLCICFPNDSTHFTHRRPWHGSQPAWSVLLREGEAVVGHVGVVDRVVRVGGEEVHVAGVRNVYVLPTYQGQGLSDALLAAFSQEALRRDFDFGMLFCDSHLVRLYQRRRWQELPAENVIRYDEQGSERPLPHDNRPMILPLRRGRWPAGPIHLLGNDW